MPKVLIELARRAKRVAADRAVQVVSARRKRKIDRILSDPQPPETMDDDAVFLALQNHYPTLPEYGYDAASTWRRAADRLSTLLSRVDRLSEPGRSILDVACGDGMLGRLFETYGHAVELVDLEDWRDKRAGKLSFRAANISEGLPYENNSFDLVCSFNAFEHFPDPAIAFSEMIRTCKPGGSIFLQFGPLYAGPWGLHAYRTLRMPYPQFLFSAGYIQVKLQELGISDLGKHRTELQYTNQWYLRQFEQLWQDRRCEIVYKYNHQKTDYLDVIREYPACFRGRNLLYEDVATHCIVIQLRRKR